MRQALAIHGFCHPRYARVRDAFAEAFRAGAEIGAGVAVVEDGETCEPSQGDCLGSCKSEDACMLGKLKGKPESCDVSCEWSRIEQCRGGGDGTAGRRHRDGRDDRGGWREGHRGHGQLQFGSDQCIGITFVGMTGTASATRGMHLQRGRRKTRHEKINEIDSMKPSA